MFEKKMLDINLFLYERICSILIEKHETTRAVLIKRPKRISFFGV